MQQDATLKGKNHGKSSVSIQKYTNAKNPSKTEIITNCVSPLGWPVGAETYSE
jgi:hypothetical protein